METNILSAAIKSREAFDILVRLGVDREEGLSDKGKRIFQEIANYYELDGRVSACDMSIIHDRILSKYPKSKSLFDRIFVDISSRIEELSDINVLKDYIELRKQAIRQELALAFSTGSYPEHYEIELLEKYRGLHDETTDLVSEEDAESGSKILHSPSADDLLRHVSDANRIRLSPDALNTDITEGGVLRKHHILIFGRPDIGKTTFAMNLVSCFVEQKLKILYLSNEDQPEDLYLRFLCATLKSERKVVVSHLDKALSAARKRNSDNFVLVELTPGTSREIEALAVQHKPDVLIVDQIRNVYFDTESRVEQLEKAEAFMRNLGKKYNMLTISFTQAGESAEGKLVLGMTDVDFSKTGMQAASELMIGIGANSDYVRQGHRMLSFPKNKLGSNKEPLRVNFDTQRCVVT